ncbi:YkgJ family cysteine cluster protein [Planctomicrobium sp. SH664]|uniref:YkgJ family cysteine cluster protein n=1 Tax=Planctomicrobium sp. SH664 TaxID=3448125 RepID=UPI003F5B5D51
MSRIPLQLPILQNWNCHNCGGCCRQHAVLITDAEQKRILSQNWGPESGIPAGQPLFAQDKSWVGSSPLRLAQQTDGACVFLNEQGLCRIHAKFGEAAKPLACRIYPYAFHPAGKEVAVSLRFSCPSVVGNRGEPLTNQKKELQTLAQLVVPPRYRETPPPAITGKTTLDWTDTLRIVQHLDESLAESTTPVALKLLRALFWIDLIGKARLASMRGGRLEELLTLLRQASVGEISEVPAPAEPPSSLGMSQFRLLVGRYVRKDVAATLDKTWSGRFRQLLAAWRLMKGTGSLPRLHEQLGGVPFNALSGPFGGVPEESERLLTRYFRVKIQGLHFFGPAYYQIPLVEGFQSLALVFPAVLWIARWHAVTSGRSEITADDIQQALMIVDHQHGYSEAFGTWGFRRRVQNLAATGDLAGLIATFAQ